jgi:phosphatidylglycerol:prolipoprotein diacylglycerol transferase
MLMHWDFNPIIFTIGPLAIRWYGLLFVGAFIAGQIMMARFFKKEGRPPEHAEQLMLYALFGTILGARLVHCLFYDPSYYLSNPMAILRIWEGGLASHGGAIGLLLGLWFGCRAMRPTIPFWWLVDRATIPSALGAIFVRLANFLNSEIIGKPTDGSWGIIFDHVDPLFPRHPVQLYEAAAYLLTFLMLFGIYKRQGDKTPQGLLLGCFFLLVFSARLVIEFFKEPQASYEAGQWLSVGQYLSLPFMALGVFFLVRAWRAAPIK